MFTVVITEKGSTRKVMEFSEQIISIGRVHDNEIVLPKGNVSKRHAKVEYRDNQFLVSDLGSTNGTYINGRRIQKSTRIYREDRIYVGDFILDLKGHEDLERNEDSLEESVPPLSAAPQTSPKVPEPRESKGSSPPRPRVLTKPPVKPAPETGDMKDSDSDRPLPSNSATPSIQRITDVDIEDPGVRHGEATDFENEIRSKTLTELYTLVETVLDYVVRQIKRLDRTRVPLLMDAGTAGKVRIIIDEFVDDLKRQGKLPPSVLAEALKGKAFRAVVDFGPISAWLDDPEVDMIRIPQPGSAFLLKNGEWIDASSCFLSGEDISELLRCLSAGLRARDGIAPGVSWYRLEEGYLVFSALSPGAAFGPAVAIDKTAARDPENSDSDTIAPSVREMLEDTIDARAKIAVIGGSEPMRLKVLDTIISFIPADDFIVTVEDIPLVSLMSPKSVRLSLKRRETESGKGCGIDSIVSQALGLEPTWLAVCGTRICDIPSVLSVAAGRLGVIAELPLGGIGQLERELSIAMTAAGSTVPSGEAAVLLEEAFDIIVIVDRKPNGAATVDKILACSVSEQGQWAPRILYDSATKH
ncbi:MAG: FHA domain-containing protein [Proteobacteria bacterium]|nr:FHA domain-containing protein [Pseudomonadota bacterium]